MDYSLDFFNLSNDEVGDWPKHAKKIEKLRQEESMRNLLLRKPEMGTGEAGDIYWERLRKAAGYTI